MKVIDFHQHLLIKKDPSGDKLLQYMNLNTIEKALVHAVPINIFSWCGDNEDILGVVKKYPERLIGSMHIDPRCGKGALDTLEKYYQKGFKWVKMFPNLGFYPGDPQYRPIFEEIRKKGLGVLLHQGTVSLSDTGGELNSQYAQPIYIDVLARLFPEINFVLAHMGSTWYSEAICLAMSYENVYVDTSSSRAQPIFRVMKYLPWYYHPKFKNFHKKVLWGYDGYSGKKKSDSNIARDWLKFLEEVKLERYKNDIFYNNAKNLLKI